MTVAKPNLLKARALLLQHLNLHPGATAADLDPAEVGIVGDTKHADGGDSYHLGKDQIRAGGHRYSVDESARDRKGLTNTASAMDIGEFSVTAGGERHTLLDFNRWLVGLCKADDPDCADIREVIYTPDGKTVRRWDRLRKRSSGDDSHLWHTHISEFRDADGARMVALAGRYLTHIGLLEGDVSVDDVIKGIETADVVPAPPAGPLGNDDAATNKTWRVPYALSTTAYGVRLATRQQLPQVLAGQAEVKKTLAAVLAAVQGAGTAEILAKLDELAAAERQRDTDLLALVAQAQTGQLDAAEVVRLIGERLAAD